jgi:hypothetical protein
MCGPFLLALQCDLDGPAGVPMMDASPQALPDVLIRKLSDDLLFEVRNNPRCGYIPSWPNAGEPFACYPMVQTQEVKR